MKTPRQWIVTGAVLAALGVTLGAFAAHGLEPTLLKLYGESERQIAGQTVRDSWKYLQDFITASRYQMYHAIGLILLGLMTSPNDVRSSHRIAAWSFLLGTLLFSGSLYVLVLTGQKWLGAIAPIGGTLMIVAWVALAIAAVRSKAEPVV